CPGHGEAGETPAEAGMRECVEEIGVRPTALYELFQFIPVPGASDEHAYLYLGLVDAGHLPERATAPRPSPPAGPRRPPPRSARAPPTRRRQRARCPCRSRPRSRRSSAG